MGKTQDIREQEKGSSHTKSKAAANQSTNTITSGSFGGKPKTTRHHAHPTKTKANAKMPAWMNPEERDS